MTRSTDAMRRENWWLQRWYGRPSLLWLLWPLEWLFRTATALRRGAYRCGLMRVGRPPVPVIVVGNIAVGGTGKTPVTIALCEALLQRGYRPGIASRGYGSRATQFPLPVSPSTPAVLAGDEPLLLARRTGCPVVIAPERAAAAAQLVEEAGCNVVICDDGLQHYALGRDIELAVIDGQRGLGNGHCLPIGPLREPPARLRRCDAVLINGTSTPKLPGPAPVQIHHFTLMPARMVPLGGGEPVAVQDWCRAHPAVQAVAGIGNPERFFDTLRALGVAVTPHPFPDHHAFSADDLLLGSDLPVVMTEKDAMKCAGLPVANAWYLTVDAVLPDSLLQVVADRIAALDPAIT